MVCELKSKQFDSLTLFSSLLFIAFFFFWKSEDNLPKYMIPFFIGQTTTHIPEEISSSLKLELLNKKISDIY